MTYTEADKADQPDIINMSSSRESQAVIDLIHVN